MNKEEYFVVINPLAGGNRGQRDWPAISGLLKSAGISFDFCFTTAKDDAITKVSGAIANGFRKIICCGGDGTLNECVNGIMQQSTVAASEITLAIIPVGTGNDWSLTHNIPRNYKQAIEVIKNGKTVLHDAGIIEMTGGAEKKYFINISGFGYEGYVAEKINTLYPHKKSNKLFYTLQIFKFLFTYKHIYVKIEADGKLVFDGKMFSASVGNCKYNGGGLMQSPMANPFDGLLNLTIINTNTIMQVLLNFIRLKNGTLLKHPKVSSYTCKSLKITGKYPFVIESDGETYGYSPARMTIIPAALRVITGIR